MAGITCPVRIEQERDSSLRSPSQAELEPQSESCQGVRDPGVREKDDDSCAEDVGEEGLVGALVSFPPVFVFIVIFYDYYYLLVVDLDNASGSVHAHNVFFYRCCIYRCLSKSSWNPRSPGSRPCWGELSKQKSLNEEFFLPSITVLQNDALNGPRFGLSWLETKKKKGESTCSMTRSTPIPFTSSADTSILPVVTNQRDAKLEEARVCFHFH